MPGDISSQFVTGLLFALPMLGGDSVIRVLPPVESRAYIDITADVLRLFGVSVRETSENTFYVRGGQSFHAVSATVEGDWSNAANLAAFNALGGEITLLGLNGESLQGDRACLGLFSRLDEPDAVIDLAPCPDLGPIMFAVAAAKSGAHFTGTRRLRIKESDRARAMADELGKFGVRVEVGENSVTVRGGGIHAPSESLDAHNDHRIVMALTALLSLTGGVIEGAEAVRKSYPGYFDELIRLGMNIEKEA
ncbi:MAG: hypothetical protein HUJ65_07790 [Oscillospiraceae bacterium]|nr:hypothetical protein [Oscillospiraceae bacterium]